MMNAMKLNDNELEMVTGGSDDENIVVKAVKKGVQAVPDTLQNVGSKVKKQAEVVVAKVAFKAVETGNTIMNFFSSLFD